MKAKTTKRALLSSALCLLLCFTMLIGTTFAWFTDKVEVTGNRIVAGNLDIEMDYYDAATKTWIDVEEVSETDPNFFRDVNGKEILWEPGAAAYATFKVANEGTLALKYTLETVAENFNTVTGTDKSLKDVLTVAVADTVDTTSRAKLISAIKGATAFDNFGYNGEVLEKGKSKEFTVIVYWAPSANDNEYNLNNGKTSSDGKALWIDLDFTLTATQATVENDSIDNTYDADAPALEVGTFDELQNVLTNGGYAKLAADIDASKLTTKNQRITIPTGTKAVLDLNGYTLTSMDGGGSNIMAIYVSRGAELTLNDSKGNGAIVASCHGVYVQPGATFTMNGGTITVDGNNVYDFGVTLWNSKFVMNGGTINAQFGVVASNYYKAAGEATLPVCEIKISDNCVINTVAGNYEPYDVDISEAADTVLNIPDTLSVSGLSKVSSAEELATALSKGGKVVLETDVSLASSTNLKNADFVLDGNGHTITMTDDATNTYALFDITDGKATIKDVIFDGIKEGAVVRTVHAEFNADNVTVKNCEITQINGLFRLLGKSTVTNCTFKNNTCNMVISLNWDGANDDPQVIKNCVFEGNTCNSTAVVYYVKGAGATIDGNKFLNNTVNGYNNSATLYMGFTKNNVITNNVFDGNRVSTTHETDRVAGALMIGYDAVIKGNSFINNTVEGENAKGNDVCVSPYYCDIDLSGNYWGGSAPVADDDYYQEYDNYSVIINDYLTTYGN